MKQLKELNRIKELYNNSKAKCYKLKTKKAREKQFDIQRSLRREFSDIAENLKFTQDQLKGLNIMAPIGGPYCTVKAQNFKVHTNMGNTLQVSFELNNQRHTGYIYLLENKSGIDNLKLLNQGI